ncbi:MAG: sel1 repeat family protein [Proteobacteria bacterium]|nr:sel1 repeat family protein [Pseudomonadota bacterium]NOG61670.1 sel1 repeat family protein [Pseudomonadota bacterium]
MTRFLSIALLSFCYITSAQADIYSASNALSRGDYETAVAEFTKLAEKGDASAQANLGYMYYAGEGVPQDYEKAVYWYRKAATQGNKDAQYNLAVSYAFGEGTKQDLTEAAIWYRRAGEQGHIVSQYSLGISYAYGEGVPQDQKEAARWFKKAAEQGYARAQVQLGSMYHTGEGVEQDYLEASRWYRMAADRGDATAQYNLGTMYRSGKGVEQNYAQAKRWFRQSADQGYAAAQNELASLERSAAANVATRTIQAKPELPITKESIPEPTPTKKADALKEPVEELVAVEETKPTQAIETVDPDVSESSKKPLFSVEKEGLLSLDDPELDIAEPDVTSETTIETEVKEAVTQTEETEEALKTDTNAGVSNVSNSTSAMHNALGLPSPKETDMADNETESSEGFFSRLFSSNENTETNTVTNTTEENIAEVIDEEPAEEVAPEPEIKKEVVLKAPVYPEDVKKAKLATIEEDKVKEVIQPDVETETIAAGESEESEGFFSRLFSSNENTETNTVTNTTEENIAEVIDEEPAEEVVPEPEIKKEVVLKAPVYPEDVKKAELATVEENKIDEIIEPEIQTETIVSEDVEESEGFFSRLFSSKESTGSEANIVEVIEEEPVEEVVPEHEVKKEVVLKTPAYPEEVKKTELATIEENKAEEVIEPEVEPVIAENNWAEASNNDDEETESGGLFSAIGNFFSGGDKKEQTEANEAELTTGNENEEVLIAKIEEPVVVNKEIELTQQAETDLSQYSVQAGRRALANGDYDEAYRQFQPLAETGDSEAQSHLGSLYYVGKGIPKDLQLAYNWYKKSADQGNVDSQYSIGNMYLLGEGVEQSNSEATKWYALASEQGHTAAKNNLKSLEKLEALNRENQSKLDAIAAEQKAKEEKSKPELITEPEEIASIEDVAVEKEAVLSSDIDIVSTDNSEPVKSESPGFFDRLFGNDGEEKKEDIALQTTDEITIVADTDEPEISEEIITNDTEEEKVKEVAIESVETLATNDKAINVSEDSSSVVEEEPESNEKPEGLFGFLGDVFSSDKKEESNEDIAMLEKETTEQGMDNIDETVSEEIAEITEAERLRPLATQGDADAQYQLGTLYYSGKDVKQDYSQAALWYRRAAQQGSVDAQYSLGNMFLMGEGIVQDDEQAAQWYAMAAEQGHSSAKHNLENIRKTHESHNTQIEQENTDSNNNQLISLDDKPASATVENIDLTGKVEYEQGLAYAFGDGVAQNDRTAFNLFYEAAEKGFVLAQYKVGVAFAYGEGVRQDMKKAAEWYRKSAEQGHTIAQRNLATMYLDGKGVEQNKVQALAWYQVVADAGNAMDVRRRDMLKQELSEVELSESQQLAEQISSRIANPSL